MDLATAVRSDSTIKALLKPVNYVDNSAPSVLCNMITVLHAKLDIYYLRINVSNNVLKQINSTISTKTSVKIV